MRLIVVIHRRGRIVLDITVLSAQLRSLAVGRVVGGGRGLVLALAEESEHHRQEDEAVEEAEHHREEHNLRKSAVLLEALLEDQNMNWDIFHTEDKANHMSYLEESDVGVGG